MPSTQFFGIAAGVVSVVAFIPYIYSILTQKSIFSGKPQPTKPERAAWFKWTFAHWLFLFAYDAAGGGWAVAISWGFALGITVVFVLSLRYGVGGWTKLDRIGFAGCFVAIAVWAGAGSPVVTLYTLIIVDFIGVVETIVKTWKHPGSEDPWMWTIDTVGNILTLFAIETWDASSVYPLYLLVVMATIAVLAHRGPKETRASAAR